MTTTDTIPTIEREIKYSRQDRDYACYVNGQYIGSRANYSDAETLCDQVAYDLVTDGLCATATALDAGSDPDAMAADHEVVAPADGATCDGDCPDCEGAGCSTCDGSPLTEDEIAADAPIAPARHWSRDLPAYGASNCAGCGGVVPCRCDSDGCTGACGAAAQLTAACTSTNPCNNPNHNHSTIYTAPIPADALLAEADRALSTCPGAFGPCGAEAHPSYAPFCQKCALALQRVAVAAYVQRLADDLGLSCSFCGEAHGAADCPLRRPLIVPGPRVCGCCGGAHHIQQCGELRAALFAKAEVFY